MERRMNQNEQLFSGCIPEERFVQEHPELQCPVDKLPGGHEWTRPVFVLDSFLLCSLLSLHSPTQAHMNRSQFTPSLPNRLLRQSCGTGRGNGPFAAMSSLHRHSDWS